MLLPFARFLILKVWEDLDFLLLPLLVSLQVRDGRLETDPLIGKYCGTTLPAPVVSSSNSLWVRFKSDSSVGHAGFRALYTVDCGGILSGAGQLSSPYHPNAYPHNKACEWVINQPEGFVVTLNFLSFDVEGGSCTFDSVEVSTT
ncbi:Tolloid-like protein 2 [Liparis tanakae]|uniref:Tolloid-like protein 2 n=1 Tax=Liparis tanakae TaxID=230148 RepID=A0A4Z2E6H6_9TELE|nr:Tolloid-like protein 2 [Liparis tanakae]